VKMRRPIITLLTDFGSTEHYVGAMKGVMLGICPEAHLIDISHEVTAYAIPEAGFTLAQAWGCFPNGTVHLIVVDPGVGSSRRPIVAEAGGHRFVAPDNGVLSMVLDAEPKHRVREITARKWFREPVSQTFHGRDIFAPVAAQIARGVAISEFGKRIDDCVRLPYSQPVQSKPNCWTGTVLKIDRFGNIVTNFDRNICRELAGRRFRIRTGSGGGQRFVSRMFGTYAEAEDQEPFAIEGSSGYLEISCKQRSAAEILGAGAGSTVILRRY
jgi:S-adenosylmethionine hydrolase